MPVDSPHQAVKKAAPLFETDIFALVATASTPSARHDTVYVFEAHRREVVSQRQISSAVTDVHFVRFDQRRADGSVHKVDGVCFFGFDEVYICEAGELEIIRVIKTSANVGECQAIAMSEDIKKLAFRDVNQDTLKIIYLNNNFEETSFRPFKEGQKISYLVFSGDVIFFNKASLIAVSNANCSYLNLYKCADNFALVKSFFLGYTPRRLRTVTISPKNVNLACISSSGTLHLFQIECIDQETSQGCKNM
jgi:hypothetical protein